jgi:ribosomal protein L19E
MVLDNTNRITVDDLAAQMGGDRIEQLAQAIQRGDIGAVVDIFNQALLDTNKPSKPKARPRVRRHRRGEATATGTVDGDSTAGGLFRFVNTL